MNDNRNRRGTVQNIRMQQEHIDKGKLQIQITSQVTAFPIQNAQVSILQSTAALHGYLIRLLHRKGEWK